MDTRLLWPHRLWAGVGQTPPLRSLRLPVRPAVQLPRKVSGLLIEYGGVLYDHTVWHRWLWKLLSRLGMQANYGAFFHLWKNDYLDDIHLGCRELNEALRSFLLSAGLSRGQIDEVQTACRSRRLQLEDETRPMPAVKATLKHLQQTTMTLAVSGESEHPAETLRRRLKKSGLGELFQTVVSSSDLGAIKPNPVSYLAALEEMKLPAEQVAYVGHDARSLEGAAQLGLCTVAFNFEPEAQADVYLDHFEELVEAVGTRPPLSMAS